MPALVKEVAVEPVGVVVPDDSGVIGAGAMVGFFFLAERVWLFQL